MSYSIKINLKKAEGEFDQGESKFFGDPVIAQDLEDIINEFEDTVLFLGQIRLSDIASLDKDNRLPHKGYLYFFVDTYDETGRVLYSENDPTMIIDGYNAEVEDFERFIEPYLMSFELADENVNGTKLFGEASWAEEADADVLLQYDPLDNATGFMDHIDGYCYYVFEDGDNLDGVDFRVSHS